MCRETDGFKEGMVLHQESAMAPFLFGVVDRLIDEVKQKPWRTMMLADCSVSRKQVEESLEKWKFAVEAKRTKVETAQNLNENEK